MILLFSYLLGQLSKISSSDDMIDKFDDQWDNWMRNRKRLTASSPKDDALKLLKLFLFVGTTCFPRLGKAPEVVYDSVEQVSFLSDLSLSTGFEGQQCLHGLVVSECPSQLHSTVHVPVTLLKDIENHRHNQPSCVGVT